MPKLQYSLREKEFDSHRVSSLEYDYIYPQMHPPFLNTQLVLATFFVIVNFSEQLMTLFSCTKRHQFFCFNITSILPPYVESLLPPSFTLEPIPTCIHYIS